MKTKFFLSSILITTAFFAQSLAQAQSSVSVVSGPSATSAISFSGGVSSSGVSSMSGPSGFSMLSLLPGISLWSPVSLTLSSSPTSSSMATGTSGLSMTASPLSLSSSSPFRANAKQIAFVAEKKDLTSTAEEGSVRLKKGWVVSFVRKEFNPEETTLILLPGIYRGMEKQDRLIQMLEGLKTNFVAVHFSSHLKSILSLKKGENALFEGGRGATAATLAAEVETVVKALNIKKPLVVSLSFSSIVVPYLNPELFPVVVETSPMGRYDESNIAGTAMGTMWANWMDMLPIYGPFYVETMKTQTFYAYWTAAVQGLVGTHPELMDPTVARTQIDGFVALARASEGFELSKQDFAHTAKRVWIFGEQEDPIRAQFQAEALQNYFSTLDKDTRETSILGKKGVFVVAKAGHVVSSDNPADYIAALFEVVKGLAQ